MNQNEVDLILCTKCSQLRSANDFYKWPSSGKIKRPCKSCRKPQVKGKCYRCNNEFKSEKSQSFCSKKCWYEHYSGQMKAKTEYAKS